MSDEKDLDKYKGNRKELIDWNDKKSDTLDALLHAVAPIPLHEVTKLIHDSNQELISGFVEKLKNIPEFGHIVMEYINDLIKEYEESLK